ncbi:MAG TPA: 2-oxoacid:acceptor oxidoreductase subunit alpha [Polyangiaceae bacterium]
MSAVQAAKRQPEVLEHVVVRFAGDSGDGMQLTGSQFAETAAIAGNDFAIFPDYPSEIRAPARSIGGVSGYQIHFGGGDILTPGDAPDVLIAMNPAALKVNLPDLKRGGIVIANTAAFDKRSLEKAGYTEDPLTNNSLSDFRLVTVDITGQTLKALQGLTNSRKMAERAKNFYALGLVYWLFNRSLDHTLAWIARRFRHQDPSIGEVNVRALRAGHAFAETAELFAHSYIVPKATLPRGRYTNLFGNEALALGLAAAAELSGLKLFLGSYPITPASDILHYLSEHRELGGMVFQAEDEIAAICSCIGAAYSGALAVTTTSGPGLALKSEALGLAVMLELPLVIVDVQRAGPSTGMPTKTEQSDLFQALFGRHGDAPLPVLAAASPSDCFWTAIQAARIALRSMTPVVLLSDGLLAHGAEPFLIPRIDSLPRIESKLVRQASDFQPYSRDECLARPWAVPGTPGLEHRIGGLEKEHLAGKVSYDGANHQHMCQLRAEKIRRIADFYPATEVFGDSSGELLVIGWGSTFGAIREGIAPLRTNGRRIGHLQLRHLNPLPSDLGAIIGRFKKVVVPEMNSGQLALLLRATYLTDIQSVANQSGKPFKQADIISALERHL